MEPSRKKQLTNPIDRRYVLHALAIAGMTGLVGCLSDDANGDDADNTPADDTADGGDADDPDGTPADDSDISDDDTTTDDGDESDNTAEPETAEVTVTVMDDSDTPIKGVSLTVIPDSGGDDDANGELMGETDADGVYTDAIEKAKYTIEAAHPDFETRVKEYVHDGPGEMTFDLEVEGETETIEMTVTVVDGDGGPVEGATVEIIPEISDVPVEEGETDSNGVLSGTVSKGGHAIGVDHSEYEYHREWYVADDLPEVTIELEETENGDNGDDPSFVITVIDEDGKPIEGASIDLQPYTEEGVPAEGETDAEGVYTAPLDEVHYTIHVTHLEYEEYGEVIDPARNDDRTVELEDKHDSFDMTVTVVGSDDEPIEGATVRFVGWEDDPVYDSVPTGETDTEGIVTETLSEDTYFLEVDHDEYQLTNSEYDHNEPSEVTIELEEI
jgi:hypothetical protein